MTKAKTPGVSSRIFFLRQLRWAIGGPKVIYRKLRAVVKMLSHEFNSSLRIRRLEILYNRGIIQDIPTPFQLWVGRWVMGYTFTFRGAYAERHAFRRHFWFFWLLRMLDTPTVFFISGVDGLIASKRGLVAHLIQTAHHNPTYDLQLLLIWDDGIDTLEEELIQLVGGTHPRQEFIRNILDRPDYHAELLASLPRFRADPLANIQLYDWASDEVQASADRFGTVCGFIEYCCGLPRGPMQAVRHLMFH